MLSTSSSDVLFVPVIYTHDTPCLSIRCLPDAIGVSEHGSV